MPTLKIKTKTKKTVTAATPLVEAKVIDPLVPFLVDIDTLRPDPNNARTHPDENLDAIAKSLEKFGQQKPIVVNDKGVVIAGNGQLEAAKRLHWRRIAAVTTDLKGIDAVAFAIADNRTGELSQWDMAKLSEGLKSLVDKFGAGEIGFAGYTPEQLEQFFVANSPRVEEATDEDQVPAPPDAATSRPGDIWVLGNHRLMCGDSSKTSDLDRLLGGQPIHLCNTDPPYNVAVEPRSNNAIASGNSSFKSGQRMHLKDSDLARHPEKSKPTHSKMRAKDRQLQNDAVTPEEFDRLLKAWFGNIARVLIPGGGFYIWGGYANHLNYRLAMNETTLYFSQCVVWYKNHRVLGRKDFMGDHEWCFYGWNKGAAHRFFGPNNIGDVWEVKKLNHTEMVHLTEKPVELARRAIEYSSKPGENVLDLFGGSGSTMIGCETTGRRAFLMELDTLYCDVIVQRWEKFTGKKADRISAKKKHLTLS